MSKSPHKEAISRVSKIYKMPVEMLQDTLENIANEYPSAFCKAIDKTISFEQKAEGLSHVTLAHALPDLMRLVMSGKKVEAIKFLRESTTPHFGLKEAKDIVDEIVSVVSFRNPS